MGYGTLLAQVDAAIRNGDALDDIDATVIEPSALASDQKAALWLYGFSRQGQRQQQRFARQQLALAAQT